MALLCGLVLFGIWLTEDTNPAGRFAPDHLPVLATPQSTVAPSSASWIATLEPIPSEPVAAPPSHLDEPESEGFNLLLLGLDRRKNEPSRTDSILLIHIHPENKTASVISIPRDTRIHVPGIGYTKINHVHFLEETKSGNESATQAVIQAVSNFFDVPIHYFVKLDFQQFIQLVDVLGGIEVNLPHPVVLNGKTLNPGQHTLDGTTALLLARERYQLPNGDFDRQVDHYLILQGIYAKLLELNQMKQFFQVARQTIDSVADTNLSIGDVISLARLFHDFHPANLNHVQLAGRSMTAMDPLVRKELWYWTVEDTEIRRIKQNYLQ